MNFSYSPLIALVHEHPNTQLAQTRLELLNLVFMVSADMKGDTAELRVHATVKVQSCALACAIDNYLVQTLSNMVH